MHHRDLHYAVPRVCFSQNITVAVMWLVGYFLLFSKPFLLVGPSLGRAGGEKLYFYLHFFYIRKLMFVDLTMSAHLTSLQITL
jgi:hypothetical protein